MTKLSKFSICGIKNISKEITLDLVNCGKSKKDKDNCILGIYGYNGAGKSAIIFRS